MEGLGVGIGLRASLEFKGVLEQVQVSKEALEYVWIEGYPRKK